MRVTQSKMLEYKRKYICVKCKYETEMEADFENRYILKAPGKCRNEDTRCKSSTFTQVHLVSREHCKDYQEIKIQVSNAVPFKIMQYVVVMIHWLNIFFYRS